MAHHTTHRRILATPDPETSMVPTSRKPKPNPSAAAAASVGGGGKNRRHPHPLPDPSFTPSSTIQNISHRFSKLYINHKKLVSKPHPHPQPDPPNLHEKKLSCTTLTKSSSQHERSFNPMDKNQFLSTKKGKKDPKEQSFEDYDMKKDEEIKGRNSVSSIPPSVVVNGGGRRRSFCNSQFELADFLSCNGVKVVAVDMPPFMQIHAVDCARKTHDSLEKFTSKTLAFTLKKEFDGVYGPAWHCIVGTSFGSFVTHSVGGFMYFSMDHKLYILLFKTTVQRAE